MTSALEAVGGDVEVQRNKGLDYVIVSTSHIGVDLWLCNIGVEHKCHLFGSMYNTPRPMAATATCQTASSI